MDYFILHDPFHTSVLMVHQRTFLRRDRDHYHKLIECLVFDEVFKAGFDTFKHHHLLRRWKIFPYLSECIVQTPCCTWLKLLVRRLDPVRVDVMSSLPGNTSVCSVLVRHRGDYIRCVSIIQWYDL